LEIDCPAAPLLVILIVVFLFLLLSDKIVSGWYLMQNIHPHVIHGSFVLGLPRSFFLKVLFKFQLAEEEINVRSCAVKFIIARWT
jgi:hypothetical protein